MPCSQRYAGNTFPIISMEIRHFGAFRDPDLGILSTVTQNGTKARSSKLQACSLNYWSILKLGGTRKKFSLQSLKMIIFSNAY